MAKFCYSRWMIGYSNLRHEHILLKLKMKMSEQKISSKNITPGQTISIQIARNSLMGPIWVQTVYKHFQ